MRRAVISRSREGKVRDCGERGPKGRGGKGSRGTHTCVREEECVALAWEPDAEHVLDRVYRVTDLRAHHNALPFTVPASDATLF